MNAFFFAISRQATFFFCALQSIIFFRRFQQLYRHAVGRDPPWNTFPFPCRDEQQPEATPEAPAWPRACCPAEASGSKRVFYVTFVVFDHACLPAGPRAAAMDRYKVERELGDGTYGTVFRAANKVRPMRFPPGLQF